MYSVCKEFISYAHKTHTCKGCVLFVACCLSVPFSHQELWSPEIHSLYLANLLYLTSTLCLYIFWCLPHCGGSCLKRQHADSLYYSHETLAQALSWNTSTSFTISHKVYVRFTSEEPITVQVLHLPVIVELVLSCCSLVSPTTCIHVCDGSKWNMTVSFGVAFFCILPIPIVL